MKKYFLMTLFCLFISTSLFAFGRPGHGPWGGGNGNGGHNGHNGGGGTPEPASILLILAGGAAAYGARKIIKKK
ncbi:MAG: PEP-CTERM sorting domain-containing protein [Spirochaetes bacterium]|nr:PEP-CTERM sorting domain-containing protein [Spirochaetota bacterium]